MVGGSVHRQRVDALHEVVGPHFRAVHKSSACTQCDEWVAGGTIRRQEQSSVTGESLADQRGFGARKQPVLVALFPSATGSHDKVGPSSPGVASAVDAPVAAAATATLR